MSRGQQMKVIQAAIERLEAEREAYNVRIDGKIEGLREAIRLQSGGTAHVSPSGRARRGALKDMVLLIADEVGKAGVSAEECVDLAKRKGVALKLGSVSSLLSRLKQDDVLFFDGDRYRLKQFAGPKQAIA